MDEQFTCRNGHRWGLRVEGPTAINGRWIFCPVCGAPPRPTMPLSVWQRSLRWAQRNPAAIGLSASVVVMLTTFGLIATMQWRDMRAQLKQAETEVEKALHEAEELRERVFNPRTIGASRRDAKE